MQAEVMTSISVPVTVAERELLRAVAERELRKPREHARFILRLALLGAGASPPEQSTNSNCAGVGQDTSGAVALSTTIQPHP